jgi:hypothetical protein
VIEIQKAFNMGKGAAQQSASFNSQIQNLAEMMACLIESTKIATALEYQDELDRK